MRLAAEAAVPRSVAHGDATALGYVEEVCPAWQLMGRGSESFDNGWEGL